MPDQPDDFRTLPPVRRGPGLFAILADPRAWKALAYLLTAAFTGPFLPVWLAIIVAHRLGLSLLIAAAAAIPLILALRQPLCWLESRLVALLLDTPRARPRGSIAYLLLRLPLGLVYFLLALVCLLLPSAFLWAGAWGVSGKIATYPADPFAADEPFWRGLLSGRYLHEIAGTLHVHGAPQWLGLQAPLLPGLVALAIGILLLVPLLHLIWRLGQWHGRLAQRMLQASGADASSDAIAATIR